MGERVKVVRHEEPSGVFVRVSRREADALDVSPSLRIEQSRVLTHEEAERLLRNDLSRDAGGPVTYCRRRLPNEPTFIPDPMPEPTTAATSRRVWRRG